PSAEHDFPLVLGVAAPDVRRTGDVDGHGDVRLGRERGRARAREVAYLLLHRGYGDHVARRSPALGDPTRHFERHVTADPVVEGAGRQALAAQRDRGAVPDGRVTRSDETLELLAVGCTDVEDEIVVVERLPVLAALSLLIARVDDTRHDAVVGEDVHALAEHHMRVETAER